MGGGDLNMKKSWHPVLLVNQERVWKAEKAANEEKKMLAQLRKEREEERQLEELHRLQEASTGKKRVEKLDWMYAAPSTEGGALGGARIGERDMEEYLLGKKRVDEVLGQGDKNIGAASREFIALQNANTARDTAAKIREDPLLAIKKQEQAALAALMNRPDIRKQLRAAKKAKETNGQEGETKEERKARKRAEKEERRKSKHRYHDSPSPSSDYYDDRYRRRHRDSYNSRDRDNRRTYRDRSDRSRTRSESPKRGKKEKDYSSKDKDYRRRDDTTRGSFDESLEKDEGNRWPHGSDGYRKSDHRDDRFRERQRDDYIPPPRYFSHNYSTPYVRPPSPPPFSAAAPVTRNTSTLEDQRAARLAAMSASADELYSSRSKSLAARAEEERREQQRDEKMRQKYGKEQASANFFSQQSQLGLGEALQRRGGKGLLKDI
ncbi:pre-mRNA-splicing factor CWC25 [Cryptococcus neoformans]|nr:pre-mRNA-splicing factor CWC25 [Cryptococcus neoformans var. grubii]